MDQQLETFSEITPQNMPVRFSGGSRVLSTGILSIRNLVRRPIIESVTTGRKLIQTLIRCYSSSTTEHLVPIFCHQYAKKLYRRL